MNMMNFERGKNPHEALGIGRYSNLFDDFEEKHKLNYRTSINEKFIAPKLLHIIDLSKYQRKHSGLSLDSFSIYEQLILTKVNYGDIFLKILQYLNLHIPVFLVDPSDMPDDTKDERSPDYLGYYDRIGRGGIVQSIFLCPERIHNFSKGKDFTFEQALAKVLIHEFGHALMDCSSRDPAKTEMTENDREFFRSIEEPLANLITLEAAKADSGFLKVVGKIIEYQPDAYRFGLEIYYSFTKNWPGLTTFELCNEWIQIKEKGLDKIDPDAKTRWLNYLESVEGKLTSGNTGRWLAEFKLLFDKLPTE